MEKFKGNEIVSISLERYENMKEKINKLQSDMQHLKMHLRELVDENNKIEKELELAEEVIKEILKEKYALKDGVWSVESFVEYGYEYITNNYNEKYKDVLEKLAIEVYKDVKQ